MKRIAYIITVLAAAVCMSASCKKVEKVPAFDSALVGDWHLVETLVDGNTMDGDLADVYLVFNACTFEIYQTSGSQEDRYDLYTGTCSSEGGVLTGTYSSGTPWGSSYTYKVSGSSLTLTSKDKLEEQIYEKADLPENIKLNPETKAYETGSPIL